MLFEKPRDLKAIGITGLLVSVVLILKTISEGNFGAIGFDSDDTMRLIQVRDFLAGQSWFDVTQYRMGPEGGTQMHWSRIADIPLIVLVSIFDLFLPYATAESWALIIWPLICAVLTIYGLLVGIRHLTGGPGGFISCLLIFMALIGYFRFQPGSIDHHNLQLALLAIGIGHALDPEQKARSFIISAVVLALSLAIGPEVYFFIAVLCGYFALNWVINPIKSRGATCAMGLTFAGANALIFFGTIAPSHYAVVTCDSFSLITFLACFTGGTGLALSAYFLSEKTLAIRIGALGILAVLCVILFLFQAPQCLENPLNVLPEDIRIEWLNQIQEAQPLFKNRAEWMTRAPYALGPVIVAIFVCLSRIRKDKNNVSHILLFALMGLCAGLMIYQIRFIVFGHVFSLLVLGPWISRLYVAGKSKEGPNVLYTGALAAAIPAFWAVPGLILGPAQQDPTEAMKQVGNCYSAEVVSALNELDPGLVVGFENDTPLILRETHHRALSGNYHRNVSGLADGIAIMRNPTETALSLLKKHDAEYFLTCEFSERYRAHAKAYPDSLTAKIMSNDLPAFVTPLQEDLEGGAVRIYRINL